MWRRERERRRKVATRSGAFSQPGGAEEPTVGGGAATCRSRSRNKVGEKRGEEEEFTRVEVVRVKYPE